MAPLYKPPTRVTSREMPYLALVTQMDPEFERDKHRQIEYEFVGHPKYADPHFRGSYNNHSNVYAVGQPYGADDPDVLAARPMFSGVPTKGWA